MAIKFLAIDSTGVPFDAEETRTVNVTSEDLSAASGFQGDVIDYTANVRDSLDLIMPPTFTSELMINGNQLASVAFQPSVYNSATGNLTIPFTVPTIVGSFTVKLTSVDHLI